MSDFRSQREQSKWESLQGIAKATIDKVLNGTATPSDIRTLSVLLKQQHDLAGKMFDQGIQDAEKTADAVLDKLNNDRTSIGKAPLSGKAHDRIFKRTFQDVLKSSIEDIVGGIKDILDEQVGEQQELVEAAFDRIRKFTAKATEDAEKAARKEAKPTASITRAIPKAARLVAEAGAAASNDSPVQDGTQDTPTSTLAQVVSRSQPAANDSTPAAANEDSMAGSSIWKRIRNFTSDGSDKFVSSVTAMATNAKTKLSEVVAQLRKPDDEDDDKKAESWIRKIKMFLDPIGSKLKAAKNSSWMSMLGKGLLMTLMNPRLIQTITDAVKKYLNFETISAFLSTTWKDIKEGGANVLSWIVGKVKDFFVGDKGKAVPKTAQDYKEINASVARNSAIPANTTAESARQAIPDIQEKIAKRKLLLARHEKKLKENPSDDGMRVAISHEKQGLAILGNQLSQYQAKATGRPAPPMQGIAVPASVASSTAVVPGSTASKAPTSSTQVVPDVAPSYKPGITLDIPDPKKSDAKTASLSGGSVGNKVSLGSFGFNSNDDTLNLLNLGVIA